MSYRLPHRSHGPKLSLHTPCSHNLILEGFLHQVVLTVTLFPSTNMKNTTNLYFGSEKINDKEENIQGENLTITRATHECPGCWFVGAEHPA